MSLKISYAISDGEGTLLDYGTCFYRVLDALINSYEYGVTVIYGPADGTGE